jgi:hypothetical protein
VFAILLVVSKFFVMKAEHTVACYNGRDFKNKIVSVLLVVSCGFSNRLKLFIWSHSKIEFFLLFIN